MNPVAIFCPHPDHDLFRKIFLERFLFDEFNGGFICFQARGSFFAFNRAVVFHSKFADQERQSQALKNERR